MLSSLSEHVRHCYERAEACARKAAAQCNPLRRQDYLEMERRWLWLARGYEASARVTDFYNEAKQRIANFSKPEMELTSDTQLTIGYRTEQIATITPFLQRKGFDPELIETMSAAFVSICTTLGWANSVLVARKVIELAQRGFKDASTIQLMALKELKFDPL
jgi:hypothetical protein